MNEDRTPLEYVAMVDEFTELVEFMEDPILEEALDTLVKLYIKPEAIPPQKVPALVVQLQAYSGKFRIMGKIYMTTKTGKAGTEEFKKKNLYLSLADVFNELAQSVKYLAKTPY